ncbi:MAG TPA: rod shape-determining protein MreD [Candidatus Marinimicrobia bacterium]|jgi:rod shape-determining protein MreD|nr:rod shape-determining protein MreD [Candidatus Neomarinimicrobiota bacterium]HJL74617.1 rod shape-determining protein MreD [Candidatus Neomarinimicrobiota bacterium]HJM70532.1 rod shape-determining protein MreD [Candidatus Neomarinimicrobiota bacterium]|tara:strand:+ start:3111 stop:3602 length:492 start_codon:yes stop_codon:yes gene_type:complete
MQWNKFIILLIGVFFMQFYLAEFMSIRMIRPDFMTIFILYTAIKLGRFYGVIAGFTLGFLTDLAGVGSYFGLSSLMYSISGYLTGFLKDQYNRLIPFYFHLSWVGIIFLQFLIFSFVRYQYLYETDFISFIEAWILTMGYTMGFILILQLIIPFRVYYRAESS